MQGRKMRDRKMRHQHAGVGTAGQENVGKGIACKAVYYLCLLQKTKYISHRVLFVATVATVTGACYHFAFRLVSLDKKASIR